MSEHIVNPYQSLLRICGKAFLLVLVMIPLISWCFTACERQEEQAKKPAAVAP